LAALLAHDLDQPITIKENGAIRRISKRQAKQVANKITLGDPSTLKLFLGSLTVSEDKDDSKARTRRHGRRRRE
jgi:hypothetical protein